MKCQLLQRLAVLNKYDKQRQPGEGVKPRCVVKHAGKDPTPACGDEVAFEEELLIAWWRQAQQHRETPTLHGFAHWRKDPPLPFSSPSSGASEQPRQRVGRKLFQGILFNLIRSGEEDKD